MQTNVAAGPVTVIAGRPARLLALALAWSILLPAGLASVAAADEFTFSFSGYWCCGTPDLGGSNAFTGAIVLDNGNPTSANQTYDPTTDFVSLTLTSGSYTATFLAADTAVTLINANYQTDAGGAFTTGDARFTGGVDTTGSPGGPSFDFDVTDNDPDFWESDGTWHRFGWDMTPVVPVELQSFTIE